VSLHSLAYVASLCRSPLATRTPGASAGSVWLRLSSVTACPKRLLSSARAWEISPVPPM
jgi:hypothetical protein